MEAKDDSRTQRYRTTDVQSDAGSFNDLLLPQPLVQALAAAGFVRPSPVQKAAIPIGRVGSDMIVQAKSGTGKTAVFATILLERVSLQISVPQALVLAPTRELAIQSYQVIQRIAAGLPDPTPAAAVFVGGLPTADDEKRLRRTCHIVVGTPGRVCALVTSGALLLGRLKCLVLDEADQLLNDSFYTDTAWLLSQLPIKKQVLAFSATFTAELLEDLEPLMKRPQKVLLCEETVSLLGIRQYYKLINGGSGSSSTAGAPRAADDTTAGAAAAGESGAVEAATAQESEGTADGLAPPAAAAGAGSVAGQAGSSSASNEQQQQVGAQQLLLLKVDALLQLLSRVSFHQAVVFCNKKPAAEWLAQRLTAAGCPSTYLSADLPQTQRMAAMEAVRGFKVRIIVSTDVMARGVDFDRVNLVVNLDLPQDSATYVHRVGRTGRFGSRGVAVAMLTGEELQTLQGYLTDVRGGDIALLPDVIPDDFYTFDLESDWEKDALQQLLAAPTTTPPASPPPMHKKKVAAGQEHHEGEYDGEQYEQWEEEEGADADWQQQYMQDEQQAAAGGVGSEEGAAAAWDAWADYYRSQGYSYPYSNPYRQQQAADTAAVHSSQQPQQPDPSQIRQQQQQHYDWYNSQHYNQYYNQYYYSQQQQQQQYWQPPWGQHRGDFAGDGVGSWKNNSSSSSNAWGPQQPNLNYPLPGSIHQHQQQPLAASAAAAGSEDGSEQGSEEYGDEFEVHNDSSDSVEEGDAEECELPVSDEEIDPRAVALLSRLQVTEEAERAAAAAQQAASVDGGAGMDCLEELAPAHTAQQQQQRQQQQGLRRRCKGATQQQQQHSWHHDLQVAPGAAHPAAGAAGREVCFSCWAAAYASWQRDYEAWRQHYSMWYSMQA